MRNFVLTAAGFLAATVTCAPAQQPSPVLTLQDCIRLAESVPSPVSIARQERDIAARELTQARAGFLPQTRLVNGFTYNSPLLNHRESFSFIPLNGIREYASLFSVQQEFDTSGRLRADMARARVAQEITATSVALTARDLRRAVTTAYYRALLTRRIVRIIEAALAESLSFEHRTKLLFQGGEAAQADVVKASAQAAFLQQALNAAGLEASLANQELASFWTRDVTATLALADLLEETPPAPEPEAAPVAPFLRRLEFNLVDAQRRGFQADARRARSSLLPQLGVAWQYGIDSTAVRINDRGYAAFINLTIPIFDWNRARSAMQQARLRAQQTESTRAISERTFSREYQSALARVKQLFEQISLTRRQAALAEEDLRLSRIRYEGGEGSALDVVTAQNQLAQARSNYYTTMANYLNARADLEVASGR
ncbi:MAG: TolC family protein [Candidatus Solibacter usitatus]|nr:TolC family protein [Candidatus Solibacter usitatus]